MRAPPASEAALAQHSVLSPARARYALFILCAVSVFNLTDRQILTILLDPIKRELQVSDTAMGLLTGMAFAAFYVTAGFPFARWADHGVRRSIVAVSLACWSLMTMISGFARSFSHLALARVGVAVGEAGAHPATHSLIADLFPLTRRATAMAMLSASGSIGILAGLLLGGWINEAFGWRAAFIAVGAPGLLLALIMRFSVPEPVRGAMDGYDAEALAAPSLAETMRHLWQLKSFRCLVVAAMANSLTGYGTLGWSPTFFIRVHDMSTTEVGLWLGLITGIGLAVGNLASGMLSDRLGRRDIRWYMWIGTATGVAMPFGVAFTLWPTAGGALSFFFLYAFLMTLWLPPTYALAQTLAKPRMRAMAAAIMAFFQNLVGIGLGPLVVGILNDALEPTWGEEAVRYSLLILTTGTFVAGAACLAATIWLRAEYAQAQQRSE